MKIRIRRLPHAAGLPLPAPASPGSCGVDLSAAVGEPVTLPPGGRALIPTGLVIELPEGAEGQVRPRSGLALEHGVTVANAPGTIDSDYRGEVGVILINLGAKAHTVHRGDRIAQLVVAPVERVEWQETDSLSDSARGEGGFGSTGVRGVLAALLLALSTLACFTVSPPPPAPGVPEPPEPVPSRRLVVLSLDGAGAAEMWRLLEEGELDAGGFSRFVEHGIATDGMIPVDPTVTATNHLSLITGFPPAATGIVGNGFLPPEAGFSETVSGFAAPIATETLWQAARRQGRKVGIVTWPGADGAAEPRRGDWGLAWVESPVHPAEVLEIRGGDWREDPEVTASLEAMRAPVGFSPVKTLRLGDLDRPGFAPGSFVLAALDWSDDGRAGYNGLLLLNAGMERDEVVPMVPRRWYRRPFRPREEGVAPYASHLKILELAPDLERVRLYLGAGYRNAAYPESFDQLLAGRAIRWPGPPDDERLREHWETFIDPADPNDWPGIDLDTWVEQAERFAAFFVDALLAGAETHPWDLLLGYVPVIDEAGHTLLLTDPRQEGYSEERAAELEAARRRVWRAVDQQLLRLIEALDLATTTLVVTADHGMAPVHTTVYLNEVLKREGLLVVAGGEMAPEATRARAVTSGAMAHVYLNPALDTGDQERAAATAAVARLLRELEVTVGGRRERPVEAVYTRREAAALGLDHPASGDLVVFPREGFALSERLGSGAVAAPATVYGNHGYLGHHRSMEAIFFALGANVPNERWGRFTQRDASGWLAWWLGIEPPKERP